MSLKKLWPLVLVVALFTAGCTEDWPMLGRDSSHSGVSTETAIGAGNASGLSLAFAGNLGHAAYASPVVAWAPSINKRLVIAGNNAGTITAFDAATQEPVWTYQTNASVMSTANVSGGVVYVGSNDKNLYALDLATGALQCKFNAGGLIQAAPTVVDPDGTGRVVYVGDVGQSGGDDGGNFWAINAVDPNAATNCSVKWSYKAFGEPPGTQPLVGSWSPPAFTHDVNGRALIVFGSSSPEGAVYALDAVTGARVWRFQTTPAPDGDVGGGITVSAPGVNGFANGVAYFVGKNWLAYALDLTTGVKLWEFNVKTDSPNLPGALRNTPALDVDRLYFSYPAGVYALDAKTGAKIWKTESQGVTTAEVFSSVAVTGAGNDKVFVVGDQAGKIWAFNASTGAKLWSFTTPGSVLSSAAYSDGRVYIAATDGTLYGFAPSPPAGSPDTTLTSPTDQQALPNPSGSTTLTGQASDDVAIKRVAVAVRDINADRWWDATTNTFGINPVNNPAVLANPGAPTTAWSLPFPIPSSGGSYEVRARAFDDTGAPDPSPASARFFVESLGSPAAATITAPSALQTVIIPNHGSAFNVTVSGSATDSGGTTPGVAAVWLQVTNVEHGETFCGAPGCNGYGWSYVPYPSSFKATLSSPNAVSTNWSASVQLYGHAHTYTVTAWAVDRDGLVQQARPKVTFCANDTVQTCPL
jgi:outer membrane protein assembly factor BamB